MRFWIKESTDYHPSCSWQLGIPVIAVKDMMASYLSLIIAHGIWEEVDASGRVTAPAGHSPLKSLAAAESNPSRSALQTRDTFLGRQRGCQMKFLRSTFSTSDYWAMAVSAILSRIRIRSHILSLLVIQDPSKAIL